MGWWCHILGFMALCATWQLPTTLIKKPVQVIGIISSTPKESTHAASFTFQLTQFNHTSVHAKIRLSWYGAHSPLIVGDEWQLTVKLKPPHGLSNPGGFNAKRWLKEQGIVATGYVASKAPTHKLQHHAWAYPITQLRQRIQQNIITAVSNHNLASIISALSIGSRSLMHSNTWNVFQATGTSHLVAISGLHVGFIAAVVFFMMSFVWRLSERCVLWYPAKQAASMAAIIAALCYGLLAGFSLPTQRAVIMITVFLGMQLLYRATPLWRRLALAFVIVLAVDPLAFFSASFWLSFSAVGWIAYGLGARKTFKKIRFQWLHMQWVIFCGLTPITLLFFQKISLAMFVANMIAIPWVSFLIVPMALLSCITLLFNTHAAHSLFWLTAKALSPLWWVLQRLSHIHGVVWFHAILSPWVLLSGVAGMLLLLTPKGFPFKTLSVFFLLPLFFYHKPIPEYGAVWLRLLDVGQGLSAIVQTQHHVLLYDAGPKSYGGFDAGVSVVLPAMRALGLHHINTVMISHGDNDHIGGAPAVLSSVPVDRVLTSVPKKLARWHAVHCNNTQHWQWDGVDFAVLSPPKNQPYQDNNSSCVLRISHNGQGDIVLPGDIEQKAEDFLTQQEARYLSARVLVAPHHGSKTSSSINFVHSVHPALVLFPVGFYNRFHFPNKIIKKRYQSIGSKMLSTAKYGQIWVRISPSGQVIWATHSDTQRHRLPS